jgi:hypothetical protein
MTQKVTTPMPDHDGWPVFTVPWDDVSSGPTDMSFLLDKPAGATGFVHVAGGHLALGDGRRWRIWGQNLTFGAALVPREMAPIVARRLAKFGLNCIRLHHMDHRYPGGVLLRHSGRTPIYEPAQSGIARRDIEPTRALDPEAMARLDYFVACCKDNGVYINLNLNVSRPFTLGDGVKQVDWLGYGKALTYFDPRLIVLQKEYAQQLLDHVNPFTGNRYAEEPAVAIVELVNENSLLESWVKGRLRGKQQEPAGTWCDIPPAYAHDLDRLWNAWLARRYSDRAALIEAWSGDLDDFEDPHQGAVRRLEPEAFAAASAGRFHDEAMFYAGLERGFFEEMGAYLRGDLGVRQVILGTSDHNHSMNQVLHVENNTVLDVIDGHVYWQHPRFPGSAWSRSNWTITNTPMVDAPDHSAPAQLSRSLVKGMPYIVSELNAPFPNDTAAEFIPVTAAYAALQDWDGLFWFDYGGGSTEASWTTGMITSFFSMANDPVKMAQTAVGALMFLRGDVRTAQTLVERHLTHERVVESLRDTEVPNDLHPYELSHLPGRLALIHATAIADFHADEPAPREGELDLPEGFIVSDTEELVWLEGTSQGAVLIDTPRIQGYVGRATSCELPHLAIELETPFAAVQLISLENAPIAESGALLLLAAARVANTGMVWQDDSRQSLADRWGSAPTRIEPVIGRVMVRGLAGAARVFLQPLDGCGQPSGDAAPMRPTREEGSFAADLTAHPATLWYTIEIDRTDRSERIGGGDGG